MTNLQNPAGWPEDFCGTVRLFPLPNLILFPHVVQPLHIFEPRYCDLLQDALVGDKLIAMALLEKGWEQQYQCQPRIASTICIGKILSHSPSEDGRHNILLVGAKRARIRAEIESCTAYRQATVDLLEDYYPPEETLGRPELMTRLQGLFRQFVPEGLAAQESFKQLIGKQLPLGILTDTITFALSLPLTIKLQLLGEHNVDIRCRILTRCLEQKLAQKNDEPCGLQPDDFPPHFSQN